MSGPIEQFRRWLESRDRALLVLVAITLAGLVARSILAVGFMLADDVTYTGLICDVVNGHWMPIELTGQYSYRPMWIYPLAASIKLLGWSPLSLVLYPVVTGSLIPLLTALWIRRHLPAGSHAPLLCAALLTCYPTLFLDSLVLANETPMIFWCLACVNLFGLAYAHLAPSVGVTARPGRLAAWALLAGIAFGAAYQVKATAIPVLGLWLGADFLLHMRRFGWPKWGPLAFAAVVFFLPILGIQAFYQARTGHFLGNFAGELRAYDQNFPPGYLQGKFDLAHLLGAYPRHLFQPDGYPGFRIFLHSIWPALGLGLAVLAVLGWKRIPADERVLTGALVGVTLGLFLFLEFWPTRLTPYYLPNCSAARLWRYMDVMGPTLAAWIAILLTLPGWFHRRAFRVLRIAALSAGFGVASYGILVRCYEFHDQASEYRRVDADRAILAPFLNVPHHMEFNTWAELRVALGNPARPELIPGAPGTQKVVLDFRPSRGGCVWTGGASRYRVKGEMAWAPGQVEVLGGTLRLVHTWEGSLRPWRTHPLQLWAYEPDPLSNHEQPPAH